jgi:hypothetical protein
VARHAATIISVRSPDGRRVAVVRRTTGSGSISVGLAGGRGRLLYSSHDACCTGLGWASDRLLVFGDDYHVETLDAITGRVRWIAGFSDFAVSPDGRWVAGWASHGGHEPERIFLAAVSGDACRVVPRPAHASDSRVSFSADGAQLRFVRQAFGGTGDPGRTVRAAVASLPRAALSACLSAR